MTDGPVTREEFERLKARVRKLEHISGSDQNGNLSESNGLDSRDASVISSLQHGQSYSPSKIKRLYRNETDIRQDKTAKQRSKTLLQKEFFKPNGRTYIYRGGGDE